MTHCIKLQLHFTVSEDRNLCRVLCSSVLAICETGKWESVVPKFLDWNNLEALFLKSCCWLRREFKFKSTPLLLLLPGESSSSSPLHCCCYCQEMTIFKFLHPTDFIHEVEKLQKKFMAFDLGTDSTGICLGDSSTKKIYPIKGTDWDGYYMSPLEQILNQISDGTGNCFAGWFIPNSLFSPQVLNPSTMAVSEMQEVLNQLASTYNVEYYIFGFNAFKMTWDDKEKYAFIRKQLKDLENDGRLTTKWFTFVDEFNSTKCANDFLSICFPKLYSPHQFLEIYTPVRAHPRYQDPGDENFICDLAKLRKRLLDSYSACYFTQEFFNRYLSNTLMTRDGKAKVQKMVDYAESIGYRQFHPEEKAEEDSIFIANSTSRKRLKRMGYFN